MRRSICYCEPNLALAGEIATWKFSYTTATSLPKGTRLKFDLLSRGREIDWEIPSATSKDKKNMIWAEIPDGKVLAAKEIEKPDGLTPAFEFTLPSEIKAGDTISIFMGSGDKNKEESKKKGNRGQTSIQRRRPFYLFIDPKGKGDYRDPEIFTIDVRGNVLKNIRIVAPSLVAKNKRFDVIIRFEDIFGNLTNNAPEGTLVEVSYEHLRENLNWKLFVPETGFINVPNLYFNEPGIYKIQLKNLKTGDLYYSAPIKCFPEADKSIYWGLLHGESEKIDSAENIEACLRHFRDERNCQFFATSPFESIEETPNELWKTISAQVAEFNEDYRFTSFLGMQWFNEAPDEGLRQLLYSKDNKPILRKKDMKTNTLKKIYKSHTPKDLISIPSFSMGKGLETTFIDFDPEFERVVEIYNAWGCSECTAKEGNLRPIAADGKNGISETEKGSIRKALNSNLRFGFVAGGLDDRGVFNEFFESDQIQYSPGLTAIIAIEQTREALFQALINRSCYATTGERMVLGFFIAGAGMGSELNTKAKPGLSFNRHISGFVAGTAEIKEITFIRNGKPFHTIHPKQAHYEFAVDDTEPLSKILMPAPGGEKPPFVYYYMRVLQEDGHIAWASPIWIDQTDSAPAPTNGKKAKKAPAGKA
ncbi:MAG: DUF3604 domain-containing protein [Verrucomicrobia bacterium]|nr:DUF3604 domain-containing protein [Verrucomicrobiota bacterium]